jgi:predicted lipoprotein with Yx(FWY)xxD motif/plastocyanin
MNKNSFAKQWMALIAIVAALVVLVACSSTPTPTPTTAPTTPVPPATTTTTPATTPPPSPTGPVSSPPAPTTAPPSTAVPAYTVKTASMPGVGDYLVDGKGMTLYYFTKDLIGKSNAAGNVLSSWPVFNPAGFVVPPSLNAADFGTITRDDGGKQATYKGWPLYYYAKDKAPGDMLGEAVGGVWFIIKVPFYTVMLQNKADLGTYLVDARGMTLYYFAKDSVSKSAATADIVKIWPVFNPASFIVPSALNAADFGTITRDDGGKQATYKGWPLYYYSKDQASGDTAGQGFNGFWFVVDPAKFPPQASPTPTPTTSPPSGPAVTLDLIARSIAFDRTSITVPAGASVTINFSNQDSGIPHNFALYTDSSAATPLFVGQTISGTASISYKFTAPTAPGTYFFRCDVHPATMTGSFIVTAASSGGGGGGY